MKAVFISPVKGNFGFEPIMWLRSQEMIQTLRQMGVEVLPLDFKTASKPSRHTMRTVVQFNPSLFIVESLSYFLWAAHHQRNLFSVIERPIIVFWDDPLGALAGYLDDLVGKRSTNFRDSLRQTFVQILPKISLSKVKTISRDPNHLGHFLPCVALQKSLSPIEIFQKIMKDRRIIHFAWDTGHIETLNSLGIIEPERVRWYPLVTYSPYLQCGVSASTIPPTGEVAFCGNVYADLVSQDAFWKDEFFRSLTTEICDRKLEAVDRSVWNLMVEEIEKLPTVTRRKYGLDLGNKPFWDYYLFTAWHAANTFVRLGILGKVKRKVSIYGLFADPGSRGLLGEYPNLVYKGNFHHFEALPKIYASAEVNICIGNGLINKGIPSKLIDCLASGGFALSDPKDDLVRLFGKAVEGIFFRNVEELNTKMEYYLSRPHERVEIVSELRKTIQQQCTIKNVCEKILACLEQPKVAELREVHDPGISACST